MKDTTKAFLIVGGIAVAGAAIASLRRRATLPAGPPFYGLPPKPWHDEEIRDRLSREQRKRAEQQWYEEAGNSIMSDTSELVAGNEEDAGRALGAGLYRQHRTLQQSFFRALPFLFDEYVKRAETYGTDIRNEAAVNLARRLRACAKEPLPFP